MFKYIVCHYGETGFYVFGSSIEQVGDAFPNANIFRDDDLSVCLMRYTL